MHAGSNFTCVPTASAGRPCNCTTNSRTTSVVPALTEPFKVSHGGSASGEPSGRHQDFSLDGCVDTPSNSTVTPVGSVAVKDAGVPLALPVFGGDVSGFFMSSGDVALAEPDRDEKSPAFPPSYSR